MLKYRVLSLQLKRLIVVGLGIILSFPLALLGNSSVLAASDAAFSLSPSSGSYAVGSNIVLGISETSAGGDNVNAVQVNLSYNTSELQYESTSLTGSFTLCGQNSGGSGVVNIGCASSTTVSGLQAIANVTFQVLSNGTASVPMTSGSDIDSNLGASVWNGTLPSASYTLTYTPPTVAISSPTSGAYIHGSSVAVNSTATANDGGTISNSQLYFNSVLVQTISSSPYNFTLNALNYADGTYTLQVKSNDSLSQQGTSSFSVIVDNGDLNGNGQVTISDLSVMASHWGTASGATYSQGDINGDGKVNIEDLALLASDWNFGT